MKQWTLTLTFEDTTDGDEDGFTCEVASRVEEQALHGSSLPAEEQIRQMAAELYRMVLNMQAQDAGTDTS